jgi:hypothetical protein
MAELDVSYPEVSKERQVALRKLRTELAGG